MSNSANLQTFKNLVAIKFQLYNSLFTSLPFHRIEKTGIWVSLLLLNCEDGYKKRLSPVQIIEDFFAKQTSITNPQEKLDVLFRFVQYVERQVVLFDALEDAAFKQINDMNGKGTLKHLSLEIEKQNQEEIVFKKMNDFCIQLVLTAHPTQFYRDAVLGIIHDLSSAINNNNENQIYTYLQQLGRTPFFQQQKPTPYDEAISLVWYLENVFYQASGRIVSYIKNNFSSIINLNNPIIKMGFWPGGDRDGNPFVKADITLQVAGALRSAIIKCYYTDVRKLKRRLTFKDVDIALAKLEKRLYNNLFIPDYQFDLTRDEIIIALNEIRSQLIYEHSNLFVNQVEELINKVELFGLHFASLDIRQDSSIHEQVLNELAVKTNLLNKNYFELNDVEKINSLLSINQHLQENILSNDVYKDTIDVIKTIKTIQKYNGEKGCNRYIISHCNSALNVIEVYGLFLISGWEKTQMHIDIIPLFETIDDLQRAEKIMKELYENEVYRKHLQQRQNKQTIMLGFSDGTKDGGYLMANWCIYKAKELLTALSNNYGIDVLFFDGRGGPPARGGGKTHQFYASMGKNISNKEIQLTIQGQTISSNFGTIEAAQYNIEQLIHAGIANDIFSPSKITLEKKQEELLQLLSEESYLAYIQLKEHPYFVEYLEHASPLRFYAETNIGSRPTKRGGSSKLTFEDLRAIPFVGAWSQLKQNVTGFYGVGTALKKMEQSGKWNELQTLYQNSLFFKTLIDNCEMVMQKCFFPLTLFLSHHEKYGEIWNMVYDEFELTKSYIQKLSLNAELMHDYPVEKLSIQMRERIVLPLLTIQQYAFTKIREMEEQSAEFPHKKSLEKLVMRCSFGIINAGRNSA
ncbi:MAG: phosphoenolpyruvate carboxylase [Bacteroidetes bacterium]|nr:phosphoenolpyruvate carboxylase [Bacteroidota bacterium]MBS1650333.1 phosphoenolpyruvate carboxylase [Bacteroidota bacterium]